MGLIAFLTQPTGRYESRFVSVLVEKTNSIMLQGKRWAVCRFSRGYVIDFSRLRRHGGLRSGRLGGARRGPRAVCRPQQRAGSCGM